MQRTTLVVTRSSYTTTILVVAIGTMLEVLG
jgi:hypothetical protein